MNKTTIARLLFYWVSSFILASSLYYILRFIMPEGYYVFGSIIQVLYRSSPPMQYIAIPCFFYGIIATLLANRFQHKSRRGRMYLTLLIIILTILISSPFGGVLWRYHDMKVGYFPKNWIFKMINRGFAQGLQDGWGIILLSFPYNILGSIICYFLTKKGIELFEKH